MCASRDSVSPSSVQSLLTSGVATDFDITKFNWFTMTSMCLASASISTTSSRLLVERHHLNPWFPHTTSRTSCWLGSGPPRVEWVFPPRGAWCSGVHSGDVIEHQHTIVPLSFVKDTSSHHASCGGVDENACAVSASVSVVRLPVPATATSITSTASTGIGRVTLQRKTSSRRSGLSTQAIVSSCAGSYVKHFMVVLGLRSPHVGFVEVLSGFRHEM